MPLPIYRHEPGGLSDNSSLLGTGSLEGSETMSPKPEPRPVGTDADEDIRMQGRLVGVGTPVAGFLRPQQLGHSLRAEYEGPGSCQPYEEAAAADVDDLAHTPPFAAALMAARIRWYVPQRQMFPAMEVSMSLSD